MNVRHLSLLEGRRAAQFHLLLVALAALCAGCGPSGPTTYPVTGTVSYRGTPLPTGVIMLRPAQGPAASADIGPDGKFEVELVAGEHAVQVVALRLSEAAKKDFSQLANAPSYIPKKYNSFETSGVTVTIEPNRTDPVTVDLQ